MQAMDGTMNMEDALEERLRLIDCTPADVRAFLAKNPPVSRLVPVSTIGALLSIPLAYAQSGLNKKLLFILV